jgi:uncharacterized membrane protein YedE/YeeE
MIEFIKEPWPWYIAGPLIALTMFLLLFFGKNFGLSCNFKTMCSIGGAGKFSEFFRFDWKSQIWNLILLAGAVLGGFIASEYMSSGAPMDLNPDIILELQSMGIKNPGKQLLPKELFSIDAIFSLRGIIMLVGGGILIGFGTRWAGGCTSGHAISGLSNLQLPSLIAVIGFFIGGIIMTYFLLQTILSL